MNEPNASGTASHHRPDSEQPGGHGRHGWMMIACCIPMLVIAIALVAAGVIGAGFLLVVRGLHGDDGHDDDARHGPRRRNRPVVVMLAVPGREAGGSDHRPAGGKGGEIR